MTTLKTEADMTVSEAPPLVSTIDSKRKDNALVFLEQHERLDGPADPATLRGLRRKVDLMVIPFLMLCLAFNFVDKVLLNYAAVMGLKESLHLKGNEFSNASSAFWIAVLFSAIVNTYPLQKLPTGKWLGLSLILWGISTACHAAVRNFAGLVAVRVLSGIFEAGLPPAIMLLSAQYYTREEQMTRFCLWWQGMGLGQICGGLISFGFQHVSPTAPLSGWRTMFLVVGLVTVLFGASICLFVPDTPMGARFFTDQEKVMILEHTKVNQVGVVNRRWRGREIVEALLDPQFWLMFGCIVFQGTGGGTITAYSAQLLRSFGFSSKRSALLLMPCGVMNMVSSLFTGITTRHFGNRWFFTSLIIFLGVAGACLITWLDPRNRNGLLAGLYLANFTPGATPVDYQWITGNTAGHTKRAFVTTSMNAAFAIGNIIGPETFRAKDAPMYKPAKRLLVSMWCSAAACTLLLALYYRWANARRDREAGAEKEEEVDYATAYAGMTDRENGRFRYTY